MPYPVFTAGQRLTAGNLSAMQWQNVIQSADQTVASSTAFVNSGLSFAGAAGAIYKYSLEVAYGAIPAADIKFDWTVPVGADMNRYVISLSDTIGAGGSETEAAVEMRRPNPGTAIAAGSGASTNFHAYLEWGRVTMDATAGAVTFRFTQFVSNATATTLRANSILWYVRVG